MNLESWIDDLVKGVHSETPVTKESVMLKDLSVITVIEDHIAWKNNWFQALKDKNQDAQNVERISSDCNCQVGKWIYSEGKEYEAMDEYKGLQSVHADFHQCAGKAVELYVAGKVFDAVALTKGELRKLSKDVSMALLKLYDAAKTEQ